MLVRLLTYFQFSLSIPFYVKLFKNCLSIWIISYICMYTAFKVTWSMFGNVKYNIIIVPFFETHHAILEEKLFVISNLFGKIQFRRSWNIFNKLNQLITKKQLIRFLTILIFQKFPSVLFGTITADTLYCPNHKVHFFQIKYCLY